MRQPLNRKFGTINTLRADFDLYETPSIATEELLKVELLTSRILEPSCGRGAISEVLISHGHSVVSRDLYDHGYGIVGKDFFNLKSIPPIDIVTNPPFTNQNEYCIHAIDLLHENNQFCCFLRLDFLSSKGRKKFLVNSPLKVVHVFSSRIRIRTPNSTKPRGGINYAWFVWNKGWKKSPVINWIY